MLEVYQNDEFKKEFEKEFDILFYSIINFELVLQELSGEMVVLLFSKLIKFDFCYTDLMVSIGKKFSIPRNIILDFIYHILNNHKADNNALELLSGFTLKLGIHTITDLEKINFRCFYRDNKFPPRGSKWVELFKKWMPHNT